MNSDHNQWHDPIVDEVRQIRDRYAASFNYDLQALFRNLKEQELRSDRTFAIYPPRKISVAP
ncbi:MAG: hypothetical protein EA342_18345 [Leptolyngbya sp. LCM1.Bin17]|nr:MAG: hypothetical protein EA342_18345 [Leptolyngbya sp. LCM1.Bin17]